MLKRFFIAMLGSMAALWLSLIIFVIGTVFLISMLTAKSLTGKLSDEASVLYLDLCGTIAERESEASVQDILSYLDTPTDDLASITEAIRTAASDKGIKGIYINCGGSSAGVASRSEIIAALKDFSKTGKWIYAYADNYSQGDYYVATAADKLYLNPVGSITVKGLTSQVMFYKDLMEKLGIGVTVVKVGDFKSAVEPYLRMDMSEPSRLQTTVFLDQIWQSMRQQMASNLDIENPDEINTWADGFCFTWAPELYVERRMVTELKYREEVEDMIRDLTGTDSKDELPLVTPGEYLAMKHPVPDTGRKHVAVLYAVGDIVDSGDGGIVGDKMVPEIRSLALDDNVRGLVLRVNSGGGSAFASEQIWKALEDFKAAGKPFYVSMGDYAASGGYYISCGADSIYCDASTLTGSIGIFGVIPNVERLVKDKVGLGIGTVSTNPGADFPDLFSAPTASQVSGMQQYVERGYETFTSRVAQGRDLPIDSVKAIGGGRVWDGVSALRIGLVDGIANLSEVVARMSHRLDLKDDAVVCYPIIEASLLSTLIKESRRNVEFNVGSLPAEDIKALADQAAKIRDLDPLQARMETIIIK